MEDILKLEEYTKQYTRDINELSPEYLEYWSLNNNISYHMIDIYDKMGKLDEYSVKAYVDNNKISKSFYHILDYVEELDSFNYHDDVQYVFAFPISIKVANRLINDKSYMETFNNSFNDIEKLTFTGFLNKIGMDDIMYDEKALHRCKVQVNDILNDLLVNKLHKSK